MKLTSFIRNGTRGYGAVTDDGICDLTSAINGISDLKGLLETGGLSRAADAADSRSADFTIEEIEFLPLIPNAQKINESPGPS